MATSICTQNVINTSSRTSVASSSTSCARTLAKPAVRMNASAFFGNRDQLVAAKTRRSECNTKVQMALTPELKNATIDKVKTQLDSTTVVAGLTYQGLSCADIQAFRRNLAPDSKFIIMKNTLLKRGVEDTDFAPLAEVCTGPNAFLFVGEEGMQQSLKATSALIKDYNKENKEEKKEIHYIGGAMNSELLTPADLKKLESLPTKTELLAKVAMIIKSQPTKVALSVKAIPQAIGIGIKAIKDQKEEAENQA